MSDKIHIHIDLHIHGLLPNVDPQVIGLLHGIDARLTSMAQDIANVLQKEDKIMASLDDLTAEVAAEKTVVDSMDVAVDGIVTAIADVRQKLQDAINSGADPVKIQAAVDQLKALEAQTSAQKDKLVAAAVTPPVIGTPPTP